MNKTKDALQPRKPRRPWKAPAIKSAGSISEVLQQGGGKPSTAPGDPGEPRKVSAQG
jgi:hypothetical protein